MVLSSEPGMNGSYFPTIQERSVTAIGRMLPAVRFRNLAQQQADGAICVSASPTPRATRPRDADIPRRRRIRSRHHRKRSVTDGIVNARPDVSGLGRRPSPRVHDGLESAFTLGGIGTGTYSSTTAPNTSPIRRGRTGSSMRSRSFSRKTSASQPRNSRSGSSR